MTNRAISIVLAAGVLAMPGCASTQLNYNTMELASTVESLQTKQVLSNISKFIDDPDTIPDQVVVSSGSLSTTNSVTPSVSGSLSTGGSAAGLFTASKTLLKSFTNAGTDQWTQSWSIAPISDGDDLRRLSALYRYVTTNKNSALDDYPPHEISVSQSLGTLSTIGQDPFYVDKEMGEFHNVHLNAINGNLCKNWIYFDTPSMITGVARPVPDSLKAIPLGHFGNHDLFTTVAAKENRCLSKFVLFVLDAAGETASPTSSGGGAKAGGPTPKLSAPPQSQFTPDQVLPGN
jgi:hypothetical protein